MALDDYTRHQQGIIKRFYENKDSIQLNRLSELVTDLYLAEGKKRDKLWVTATTLMQKLEVPAKRIEQITTEQNPELLAKLVKEMQG
ncbi:hypothetical protein BH11PLA2_BH11PLA2_15280 [soil metagenome]